MHGHDSISFILIICYHDVLYLAGRLSYPGQYGMVWH